MLMLSLGRQGVKVGVRYNAETRIPDTVGLEIVGFLSAATRYL